MTKFYWMYQPLLFTLGEAFQEAGASVALMTQRENFAFLTSVKEALAQGRQPLVVALAYWFGDGKTLKDVSKLGATIILYQTEPYPSPVQIAQDAHYFRALETWDYSLANTACCYPPKTLFPHRYVPPGYVKANDFGVDLFSPRRKEDRIGFLGELRFRPEEVVNGYFDGFGGALHERADIWSVEDLAQYMQEYPVQLNRHKEQNCCPSTNSMESFRMSSILSNKACVISAPSHPLEQENWKGIVHFVELPDTPRAFQEIGKDV